MGCVLVERDYKVLREVGRWRFCLGRHIRVLTGFRGARACDRRLKVLIGGGYLERKKILYGIPSIYTLTHKGRVLLGFNKRQDNIRIDRIVHDIAVLDTVIYFMHKENINLTNIVSEKELNSQNGFGKRSHSPDFIFTKDHKKFCVEVELSLKAKHRIEENVKNNFLKFDFQKWIVPSSQIKISEILEDTASKYPNIEMLPLEVVSDYVKKI